MKRPIASRFLGLLAAAALVLPCLQPGAAAAADAFPSKDIRFVVPVSPGGGMDTAARLLAKHWQEQLDVSVVVQNLPGAEYNNGIFAFLKAPADGHTIIMTPGVIVNQLFGNVGYDLTKWKWVGRISESVQVGVASRKSGVTSLAELRGMEVVKAAVTGLSSSQTIGQLLTGKELGFKVQPITHKGTTPAILSVIRGDSDWTTAPEITMVQHIQSGDVVPLYVASEARIPLLPDVPTLGELGFPQVVDMVAFERIVAAHPDTDAETLEQLRASFAKAMADPGFVAAFTKLGDPPSYADGDAVAASVGRAMAAIAPNVAYINSFK